MAVPVLSPFSQPLPHTQSLPPQPIPTRSLEPFSVKNTKNGTWMERKKMNDLAEDPQSRTRNE